MIAGDETALAARLGVSVRQVVECLLGEKETPTALFLQAVDIVLAHTKAEVRESRSYLDDLRRRHRAQPPPGG